MDTPTVNLVNEKFECDTCKRTLPINKSGGTGYAGLGVQKICYDCVGRMDAAHMMDGRPIVLYFRWDHPPWENPPMAINWPGTIEFLIEHRKTSFHNIAGKRHDVWFIGPDGAWWHGVNIGDNQILRCHRLKRQRKNLTPLQESSYFKPYPYEYS